jgi:Uma2 family endonuclease
MLRLAAVPPEWYSPVDGFLPSASGDSDVTTVATLPPPSGPAPAPIETLADLMERLGHVPLERVRFHPYPGTAVEQDVLEAEGKGLLCELVDGVLVEKAMGYRESLLAAYLIAALDAFARPRNLGLVTGEAGTVRLFAGLVRIPDVAFTSWDRLPGRRVPDAPLPHLAPDLAVEVLSRSNTAAEMARKRRDYFAAGVRLVWLADPVGRTVDVYTTEHQFTRLTEADVLEGGAVLPGFRLPLRDWFAELDRQG